MLSNDAISLTQVLHKTTTLKFEFAGEAGGSSVADGGSSSQQVAINLPNIDSFKESEHEILAELVRRYKVPMSVR
jgi:hypothetical protein